MSLQRTPPPGGGNSFKNRATINTPSMSVNNIITNTPNEYILSQQNQALFQENYQRSQNEQQLYNQWQYATNGWQIANNEIIRLNALTSDLQKQIDELKANLLKGRPGTPFLIATRSATPASSRPSTPTHVNGENIEYHTDEDELAKETEWIRVKHKTKKRKMNTTPSPATPKNKNKNSQTNIKENKKEPMPPPIILEDITSYEVLYNQLISTINADAFQTKIINDTTVKINCIDSEAYRIVVGTLNRNGNSFHSYENKQTRVIRVMAKNLHHTCNPENIMKDLICKGYKIKAAVNKLAWKKKTPLNMFMLFFENNEDIERIYKIKNILGCQVEIVPIKGTKLVPQCKNCQTYGHTNKYCSKPARCVKCAGRHHTQECNKTKEQAPKCVHCGGDHPANYRGCIVAKELQKVRNSKIQKPKTNSNNKANKIILKQAPVMQTENKTKGTQNKLSYAAVTKLNTAEKNVTDNQNNNISQSLQLILNKMTILEKSFSNMNERVIKLESSNKKTTSKPKRR